MLFTDASLSGHNAFLEQKERKLTPPRPTPMRPSGSMDTNPRRKRSRQQRCTQHFDVQLGQSELMTSVGHGPSGIDTAHHLVSDSVTSTLSDACTAPSRRTKATANNKMIASLRRENKDWAGRAQQRKQRDGVTDVDKSINFGNHFLKVLHCESKTRRTVPDWH